MQKPSVRKSMIAYFLSNFLVLGTDFVFAILLGRLMAQAVSGRPLAAKTRDDAQASPCGICGGQNGTGTCFFQSYFLLLLSV
jgi:hypothetical protein